MCLVTNTQPAAGEENFKQRRDLLKRYSKEKFGVGPGEKLEGGVQKSPQRGRGRKEKKNNNYAKSVRGIELYTCHTGV